MMAMKPFEIALAANIPFLCWGEPGVGKTAMAIALAKHLELHGEVLVASMMLPEDFMFQPNIANGRYTLDKPGFLRRLEEHEGGILFIDELTTNSPALQKPLLRLAQERVSGQWSLHPKVRILSASNPPSIGGNELDIALSNRFMHGKFDYPLDRWATGITAGFENQFEIRAADLEAKVDLLPAMSLMSSFAKAKGHSIRMPKEDQIDPDFPAWPSRRSCYNAAVAHAYCMHFRQTEETIIPCLSGCIGSGLANEYWNYIKEMDLPQPEQVLREAKNYRFPERMDRAFAVLTSCTSFAAANPEYWDSGWRLLLNAIKSGRTDLAAIAARPLVWKRHEKGMVVPPEILDALRPFLRAAGIVEK